MAHTLHLQQRFIKLNTQNVRASISKSYGPKENVYKDVALSMYNKTKDISGALMYMNLQNKKVNIHYLAYA